jgi:hypothetical protein
MKTDVRLNSVVLYGAGASPECTALELIYIFLLERFEQNYYKRIIINQIGDDLEEFVLKEPNKKIHVNIRYPVYVDFEKKSIQERNMIRLDIIHNALLRVAAYDKKLNSAKLEAIRNEILEKDFQFEFPINTFIAKSTADLVGKLTVIPNIDRFDFYVTIKESGDEKCRIHIYSGRPVVFCGEDFFFKGVWKNQNQLSLSGKQKEIETIISVGSCNVQIVNLTPYNKPPYYTLMRADVSQEERDKAFQDYKSSLPPSFNAIADMGLN